MQNNLENNVDAQLNQFLVFEMHEELFAVNIHNVKEILEVPAITKVPKAPEYMCGVINLRGAVLPVIDTRVKFNMSAAELSVKSCIIVMDVEVEGEKVEVGSLVDEVQEVIEFDLNDLKPSPTIDPKFNLEFILGLLEVKDKYMMLLDINKVYSVEDISNIKKTKN